MTKQFINNRLFLQRGVENSLNEVPCLGNNEDYLFKHGNVFMVISNMIRDNLCQNMLVI